MPKTIKEIHSQGLVDARANHFQLVDCLPKCLLFLAFAAFAFASSITVAQSVDREIAPATLAIKFDVSRLAESHRAAGGKLALPSNIIPPIFGGVTVEDIKSISAFGSVAQDIEQLSLPREGTYQFVIRVEFTSTKPVEPLLKGLGNVLVRETIAGKSFLTYSALPQKLLVHKVDNTIIEVGTTDYVLLDPKKRASKLLAAKMEQMPAKALTAAFDATGNSELLSQLHERFEKFSAPQIAKDIVEIFQRSRIVELNLDFADAKLLLLKLDIQEGSEPEKIQAVLQRIIETAKAASKPFVDKVAAQNASLGVALESGLAELSPQRSGNSLEVSISKPDDFEALARQMQSSIRNERSVVEKKNNLRQSALGILNYEATWNELPFHPTDQHHKDLSWRTKILPFVGERGLAAQLDLKKSPDENSQLARKCPSVFGTAGKANARWIRTSITNIADIQDGTSNTIMLIEDPKGVAWLQDNSLSPEEAIERIKNLAKGEELMVVFYDGSLGLVNNRLPTQELLTLFKPKDGVKLDPQTLK